MANKRLNAIISIGGAVASSLRSSLNDTTGKIGRVGDALRKLKREQAELSSSVKQFAAMGYNVDQLKNRYNAVTASITKQRQELERLRDVERQRQQQNQARSETRSAMLDTVGTAGAIALPVIGATRAATRAQYDLQLIANTANMTTEQMQAMGRAIVEASRLTGQSAPQMREALGFLIAAGLDIQTATASLVQIGRTATASGANIEDLSRAAFTLVDTLKIKPGQELQQALDTLAQAGKEGNVELRDMAKVLPVLGAGFQALKMDGREAAATMGAALEIARKGAGSADEAANNLQNFVNKVASPETLKKAQQNFGLDLYKIIQDAQARGGNPFEAAVKAIIGVTEGDQKKIGELFGDMQVQNFIRPMIQNFEEYERIKRAALTAEGVTDRDFALVMETAKEQFEGLGEEAGRLGEAIGGPLAKAFGSIAAAITPVIRSASDLATRFPQVTTAVVLTGTALAGLRIGMLAAKFAALTMAPVLGTLATALRVVGTAALFMGRALLLNPIGLAVTAIAGAAFLIYRNWDTLRAQFSAIWSAIEARFDQAAQFVTSIPGRILQAFRDLGEQMRVIGGQIIDGLLSGLTAKWEASKAYIASIPGQISGAFKSALGIQSPSRVFAQIGRDTMAGLDEGLQNSQVGVIGRLGQLAKDMAVPIMATATLAATPAAAAPSPVMAAAAGAQTSNTSVVINIYQQPGQDARALARQIEEILRQRSAADRRSTMTDEVNR